MSDAVKKVMRFVRKQHVRKPAAPTMSGSVAEALYAERMASMLERDWDIVRAAAEKKARVREERKRRMQVEIEQAEAELKEVRRRLRKLQ